MLQVSCPRPILPLPQAVRAHGLLNLVVLQGALCGIHECAREGGPSAKGVGNRVDEKEREREERKASVNVQTMPLAFPYRWNKAILLGLLDAGVHTMRSLHQASASLNLR